MSKLSAAFQQSARNAEIRGVPQMPTPEPDDNRPPLTPGVRARLEAEMAEGRRRVALAEAEQERVRKIAADHRAKALKEGKPSNDDLS